MAQISLRHSAAYEQFAPDREFRQYFLQLISNVLFTARTGAPGYHNRQIPMFKF